MTSQTPAIAIPLPRRPGGQRRRLLGLASILTVAAAVVVAGGLWQATRDGGTKTAPPPAVAVEQSTVARPVASTPTYYLVGTVAEAAALRELVAQLGTPPLPVVVTLATTADADAFFVATDELNDVRTDIGLAPVTVVDLRTPAVTATTADPLARELEALTAANTVPALSPETLSDQELYSRWAPAPVTTQGGMAEVSGQQQANRIAEARLGALGDADARSATTPASTCESFEGGDAC